MLYDVWFKGVQVRTAQKFSMDSVQAGQKLGFIFVQVLFN